MLFATIFVANKHKLKMKKTALFSLITAVILSACVSQEQKDKTISLSGAFALYPMVIKWSEEYKKEHEEVRFNISAGGAGKGMTDALSGTVDLGMFSREIAEEEKAKGVWWVGLCIDAVLPTISADNPNLDIIKKRGLTKAEFKAIFIDGSISRWEQILTDGKPSKLEVYTRSDACGAAATWGKYMGGSQEDLKGIGIHADPGLADAVAKDPSAIGYNNTAYIYDIKSGKKNAGIEVVPIDINENGKIDPEEEIYDSFEAILNAIASGIYPSPPARELYFVSKGKPEKQTVLDFLEWVLTEGQAFVKEAGYVPISDEKIEVYLEKIQK
jgi:phosphate transport system substrate-binding protein